MARTARFQCVNRGSIPRGADGPRLLSKNRQGARIGKSERKTDFPFF